MTLTVLGLGLVSPAGLSARDHVFFPRAEAPLPAPSPYLGLDGRRIDARHCPCVAGHERAAFRLFQLVSAAIAEATADLSPDQMTTVPVYLVLPAPRPDLPASALDGLARVIDGHAKGARIARFSGAAGAFAALAQIEAQRHEAALVCAVDSLVGADAVTERIRRPPSPWLLAPPFPGEGGAALLVGSRDHARRMGIRALGEILASATATGRGTDDDDDPIDAAAMTALLRGLPARGPIRAAFGQSRVGHLRMREWETAVARNADRFDTSYVASCIEADVAEMGAAAGLAYLVHAFACFRHGAVPESAAAPAPFLAWAMSRDGARGVALCAAAAPDPRALAPLTEIARARSVDRDPFVPEPPAPEDDPFPDDWDGDEAALEAALGGPPENEISPPLPALPEAPEPLPLCALDPDRAGTIPRAAFHASVVEQAAELVAALGRDRLEGSFGDLAEIERRLLCQIDAIVAAGPRAILDLAAYWEAFLDDPWKGFSCALAAAAFEGDDATALILHRLRALPPDAEDHAVTVTEALALSDHPSLAELARALEGSPHPILRAAGIGLRSARGDLSEDAVRAALGDPEAPVVRAAIWAAERLPAEARDALAPALRDRARHPHEGVAWSAARVLAIWGDRDIWADALDGALDERLGARVIDLYVLRGAPADWPRLEATLGRLQPAPAIIAAVARFGHPAAGDWLTHRLADEALAEDAAAALRMVFGDLVPRARALVAGAWRRAIEAARHDGRTRLLGGEPWSPQRVAALCASGSLSRIDIEQRLDELRARTGLRDAVDISGFRPIAEANLSAFLGRV